MSKCILHTAWYVKQCAVYSISMHHVEMHTAWYVKQYAVYCNSMHAIAMHTDVMHASNSGKSARHMRHEMRHD